MLSGDSILGRLEVDHQISRICVEFLLIRQERNVKWGNINPEESQC